MRALVIGADGFAGRWLLRHLVESGDEVTAGVGPGYGPAPLPGGMEAIPVDVRDHDAVRAVVTATEPGVVFYLAGVSRAGVRDDLGLAVSVSVDGALNVLTAAAELRRRVRLLHVGSSHVYAPRTDETPIGEDAPVRPMTVYGAAKAAAEAALLQLAPAAGVEVVLIRAFNHIGPGQAAGFVVPSLAEQVVRIAHGEQEPIVRAGSLDVRRDFTDVRDVVRAYRLAALRGIAGAAYNVASGRAVSVRTLLDTLLQIASVEADVRADPHLFRSGAESHALVGSAAKLTSLTGWRPRLSLEATLRDVLDQLAQPTTAVR